MNKYQEYLLFLFIYYENRQGSAIPVQVSILHYTSTRFRANSKNKIHSTRGVPGFISELGSSAALRLHASMSFIGCSACPRNITARSWLIYKVDKLRDVGCLRRVRRRCRGNDAATVSHHCTSTYLSLSLSLSLFRIFSLLISPKGRDKN